MAQKFDNIKERLERILDQRNNLEKISVRDKETQGDYSTKIESYLSSFWDPITSLSEKDIDRKVRANKIYKDKC